MRIDLYCEHSALALCGTAVHSLGYRLLYIECITVTHSNAHNSSYIIIRYPNIILLIARFPVFTWLLVPTRTQNRIPKGL